MTVVRALLLLAGLSALGVGTWHMLSTGAHDLVATTIWLGGGVLAHDVVLAGLVLGLCTLGAAVLPAWWRAPAAAVVVLLGSLTLMALPVLGRFGARADNPTLLDRPYVVGWLGLAGLVWSCACGWAVVLRRRGGA